MLLEGDLDTLRRVAVRAVNRVVDVRVERFKPKLRACLDELLSQPSPHDWRERLAAFVERAAVEDKLRLAPRSVHAIERLIESRATRTGESRPLARLARNAAVETVSTEPEATTEVERNEPDPANVPLPPLVGYPRLSLEFVKYRSKCIHLAIRCLLRCVAALEMQQPGENRYNFVRDGSGHHFLHQAHSLHLECRHRICCMNIEFKEPWVVVGEFAINLAQELEREMTENHVLWGKNVRAIAQRTDSDDVLFVVEYENEASRYAVVHLTWSGERKSDLAWPETKCYGSLEEWSQNRMMPDHKKFLAS